MNKALPIAATIIALAAFAVDAAPGVSVGAAYRGGMKVKAKGDGSHAAGTAFSSSRTSGEASNGQNSDSSSLSFGYTGGERTFGSGTTALGSGTIHADGTYVGGDYSSIYDDVYFSDNRTTTETVGGRTSTKSSTKVSGGTAWDNDRDLSGWGIRADAEWPIAKLGDGFALSVFAGLRGFWGIDGACSGKGPSVNYKSSTSTSGSQTRRTDSFYDVTAPLNLDGTLDFANAEVFEGNSVTYKPVNGKSSRRSSSAVSVSKIDAEADLYQVAIGVSAGLEYGRWTLSARPALLLNDIDADATRTEALATAAGKVMGSWRDTASKSKFAVGVGAELALECALGESWGVFVSGGYEWIRSVEFDIGPQRVELDPSAWTVSVGIRYTF